MRFSIDIYMDRSLSHRKPFFSELRFLHQPISLEKSASNSMFKCFLSVIPDLIICQVSPNFTCAAFGDRLLKRKACSFLNIENIEIMKFLQE